MVALVLEDQYMNLISKILSRSAPGRVLAGTLAFLLLLVPLASCSTTPPPLQFATLDLHLPPEALNAPVAGPLPDNTPMRVGITFKVSQSVLDRFDKQKVQPGKRSNLENFANQIGIDDATYQKIKDIFNHGGIGLKLSKLHTHLTITAKAKTLAKVLQTSFVNHKLNGRTFFAPDAHKPPKLPKFLVDSIAAITGLTNYSSPPQPGDVSQLPQGLRTKHHP